MRKGRKFVFTVGILTCTAVYVFWEQIIIGGLFAYSFATNKAVGKRLIAEYYSDRSQRYAQHAALYFQKALAQYKQEVKLPESRQQQLIKFLIGTHYECGRGVPVNVRQAKEWYQQALKEDSNSEHVLQHLNDALLRIEQYERVNGTTE